MTCTPSFAEFARLAKRGNTIPVYRTLSADLETPLSVLMKIDDGRYAFLLESVEGQEHLARYSFVGTAPAWLYELRGGRRRLIEHPSSRSPVTRPWVPVTDPLADIRRLMAKYRWVGGAGLPRFCGGLVGFLGYDVARAFERLPAHAEDDLHLPDAVLMLAESMVIIDHVQRQLHVVAHAQLEGRSARRAYDEAIRRIEVIVERLQQPVPAARQAYRRAPRAARVASNVTPAAFHRMVQRAKRYIREGDIIQVVLSQRFAVPMRTTPLAIYRGLRQLNPSPYMYYLRCKDLSLVGSSPEMLVRCEDGVMETRPIAGTRPRGTTAREEARLIEALLRSPKERAEHIMLVDLGRNDLGRVAEPGSVQTSSLMTIEKYSHVIHLVSDVTARLRRGASAYDVLRAAFPAGTVTGAPKVRAMEIIAELERLRRGPYAGCVGYFDFSGNMDTCITIRTVVIKGRTAYVQAGAGIVADSQPAAEYRETVNKAKGMLQAIALAERGEF